MTADFSGEQQVAIEPGCWFAAELPSHFGYYRYQSVFRNEIFLCSIHLQDGDSYSDDLSSQLLSMTSIYYLLENEDKSAFHRLTSPEVWYYHAGYPLMLPVIQCMPYIGFPAAIKVLDIIKEA